jgi:hypothetical protein
VLPQLCPANTHGDGQMNLSSVFCAGACPSDEIEGVDRPRVTLGPGAVDASACVCQIGFYKKTDADECAACGAGTDCKQAGVTLARLPLESGRWRVTPASTRAERCRNEEACTGGTPNASAPGEWANGQCAEGFEGPLCGVCVAGYRKTAEGCGPCNDDVWASWTIAAIVLSVAILILAFMLWRRKSRAKKPTSSASKRRLSAKIEKVRRLSGTPPANLSGVTKPPPCWRSLLAVFIVPIAIFLPMTERIFRDWILKGVKKGLNKHKAKMRILVRAHATPEGPVPAGASVRLSAFYLRIGDDVPDAHAAPGRLRDILSWGV